MLAPARGAPRDEPSPEHDPEAAEEREVEHQRGGERAEQGDRVLPAEECAVEGEGEEDRVDCVLPAGILDRRRPEQPPGDDQDDRDDREACDQQRQDVAARFGRVIGHRDPPASL